MGSLLGGPNSLLSQLLLREGPPHGPGLLGADLLGRVLLSLAELPDSLLALGVVDGEDAGDGLADDLDLHELGSGPAGHLGDAEAGEFDLELIKLLEELLLGLRAEFVGFDGGHFY